MLFMLCWEGGGGDNCCYGGWKKLMGLISINTYEMGRISQLGVLGWDCGKSAKFVHKIIFTGNTYYNVRAVDGWGVIISIGINACINTTRSWLQL